MEIGYVILAMMRSLLTTPSSLPQLEWLDIELQRDHIFGYDLIDAEIMQSMPSAMFRHTSHSTNIALMVLNMNASKYFTERTKFIYGSW